MLPLHPGTPFIQCDLCELGNANDNIDDGDGGRIKIRTNFLKYLMINGKTSSWQKKSAPSKSRVEIPNLTTSLNLVVERGGYLSPIFAGTA